MGYKGYSCYYSDWVRNINYNINNGKYSLYDLYAVINYIIEQTTRHNFWKPVVEIVYISGGRILVKVSEKYLYSNSLFKVKSSAEIGSKSMCWKEILRSLRQHGQRRWIQGPVTKVFVGSNPIPRTTDIDFGVPAY